MGRAEAPPLSLPYLGRGQRHEHGRPHAGPTNIARVHVPPGGHIDGNDRGRGGRREHAREQAVVRRAQRQPRGKANQGVHDDIPIAGEGRGQGLAVEEGDVEGRELREQPLVERLPLRPSRGPRAHDAHPVPKVGHVAGGGKAVAAVVAGAGEDEGARGGGRRQGVESRLGHGQARQLHQLVDGEAAGGGHEVGVERRGGAIDHVERAGRDRALLVGPL